MKGCITSKKIGKKRHYYIVVDLPHLPNQKRQQKWFPVGTSKREAENMLPEILRKVKSKGYVSSQNVFFKDVAEDYLFRNQKRLAASTYKRYSAITREFVQHFGDLTMSNLETHHTEKFFIQLQERGLSTLTINKYRVVLSQICTYAQDLKIIETIPLARTTKSTNIHNYTFQVWSADEIKSFLNQIDYTPLFMPVFLAAETGMRLGEVLALQWSEVDFDNKQLTVRYSIDVNNELKTTKTKKSRRTIKLMNHTLEILKRCQYDQKKNRIRFGKNYKGTNFVCTFVDGTPLSRNYVTITFRRKVQQLGFKPIRFHDLRHSFATIALANNVNPKVIQEILGHSTIRTTLDVYSHVIPTLQEESIDKLEKAFNHSEVL